MNYQLIIDSLDLIEEFEDRNSEKQEYENTIQGFKHWIIDTFQKDYNQKEPNWEGKEDGRSPESVINTLIVHMNRYAKSYSKSAIYDSEFSTQEDFIYLINLKVFGAMKKIDLIRRNKQEKPAGIQIINRIIQNGWVEQKNSNIDKRSKIIEITDQGLIVLEKQMDKIRKASNIVTGSLSYPEKMELIRILNKLDAYHQPIYSKNIQASELLDIVYTEKNKN